MLGPGGLYKDGDRVPKLNKPETNFIPDSRLQEKIKNFKVNKSPWDTETEWSSEDTVMEPIV